METKTSKKTELQKELLAHLKKLLALHSVYVISTIKERKSHKVHLIPQSKNSERFIIYTLLIITYRPISKRLGDFMDEVYNKMHQRCKIYPIMYALSNVKKRLNYGDDFLYKAIFHTPCIYRNNDCLSQFSKYSMPFHQNVYDHIQETWKSRMDRAGYLLSIIGNIEPEKDTTSMMSIMHHALEQICLGLLYLFWKFEPQHYSLSYMLHLCSHFCRLPDTIFPKETYGLHRMRYILCNVHHIMRFKAQNEFSYRVTEKAHNRCEQFYHEAKKLGEAQLEYLKELHCDPTI
ncbi:hypothetical protein [Confluentibacter sediminis]|uniref:hypothetical protein n=1 Tax=Confluentibacter sediminis TaxID=2219045 RepID=UPI0013A6F9C1|nr:hypothetical protein [Confluentibacter sediminis]